MARVTREEGRLLTLAKLRAAARQEFAEHGVGGASIDRLTEKAGLSRGAFYGHFKGKDDILLDMLRPHLDSEVAGWRRLIEQFVDIESFYAAVNKQFSAYLGNQGRGMFTIEVSLYARRNPSFGLRYAEYLRQISASVDELLLLLFKKSGRAVPDDFHLMTPLIRSLAQGLLLDAQNTQSADILLLAIRSLLERGKTLA